MSGREGHTLVATSPAESKDSGTRVIDLSHVIENGMVTYKGFPAPLICDYMSRERSRALYARGTEFRFGRIDMVAITGTYLDTPYTRYADGYDLSELPLERVSNVPGVVVRLAEVSQRSTTKDFLRMAASESSWCLMKKRLVHSALVISLCMEF